LVRQYSNNKYFIDYDFFAIVLDIGGPVSRGANYAYEIKGKLDDINDKLSKLVDKEDNKD